MKLNQEDRFGPEVATTCQCHGRDGPLMYCRGWEGEAMYIAGTNPWAEISNRRRVLCVDDAQPALILRALILETKGYVVTTFNNALKAAEKFERGKFDLAILDYEMPAMNGGQLAKRLKAVSPELRVILYTGVSHVPKANLHSIDAIVHKSEGVDELLDAIKALLPVLAPER